MGKSSSALPPPRCEIITRRFTRMWFVMAGQVRRMREDERSSELAAKIHGATTPTLGKILEARYGDWLQDLSPHNIFRMLR